MKKLAGFLLLAMALAWTAVPGEEKAPFVPGYNQAVPEPKEQLRKPEGAVPPSPSKLAYFRPQAPAFTIPPYKGERYEDLVPDTYDIAERAMWALKGITSPVAVDAGLDYEAIFNFNGTHSVSDICTVKYFEVAALLRLITGSDLNNQVDRIWMEGLLKSIGPDGLYYFSRQGRPWVESDEIATYVPKLCGEDGTITDIKGKKYPWFTYTFMQGRALGALALYWRRDGNPLWRETGIGMIKRLAELAIEKEDYAYVPLAVFVPHAKVPRDAPMPQDFWASELGGRLIQGPAQFYRATGWKPALELSRKFANYLRWHSLYLLPDGRWDNGGAKAVGGHTHAHALGLLSLLDYAQAAGDHEMMGYVAKSYEWARGQGSTLTGWYPEWIPEAGWPPAKRMYSEPCAFADMIALAVKLSHLGVGDYWDDADRWIRNIFDLHQPQDGIFAPCCCAANGARAMYYVWETMIEERDGRLKINLLLNRAGKWADVYSCIPYEGRVEIKIKQPLRDVLVRAPQWIATGSDQVSCTVGGKRVQAAWAGRYVRLGPVAAGERIAFTFPIAEREVLDLIWTEYYLMTLRGTTLVHITPLEKPAPEFAIKNCPYPCRDALRSSKTPWRKVMRFVTAETLEW